MEKDSFFKIHRKKRRRPNSTQRRLGSIYDGNNDLGLMTKKLGFRPTEAKNNRNYTINQIGFHATNKGFIHIREIHDNSIKNSH
jgi:hypothetical protein